MTQPKEGAPQPEQDAPPEVDWNTGKPPAVEGAPNVAAVTSVLLGAGGGEVASEMLTQLHAGSYTPDTSVTDVPIDVWRQILAQLDPQAIGALAQVSKFFQRLVRELGFPESYRNPNIVHVHSLAQLQTAVTRGGKQVAVHADIETDESNKEHVQAAVGAAVGAAAMTPLLLGPGVTATGITRGSVTVYERATATDISDGTVHVDSGGTATNISGGTVTVWDGGTATNISGGTVHVDSGGTATNISGGTVTVWDGDTATNISDGTVDV